MEAKKILDKLYDILLWVFYDLNEFDDLFPKDSNQIDLLNEVAPGFFGHINEMFFNSLFLSISNFFDPYKQFGHNNITIKILIEIAEELNYSKKAEVIEEIRKIESDIKHIIDYRRKYLAHQDFDFAFGNLEIKEVTKIDDIRKTCDRILGLINRFYELIGEKPEIPILMRSKGGAYSLVNVLKDWSIYRNIDYLKQNPDLFFLEKERNKYK